MSENVDTVGTEQTDAVDGNNKHIDMEYDDREKLDSELLAAISDIISAEREAERMIAQSSASVKAVQLDGATRERDMKTQSEKLAAASYDKALKEATERAEADVEKRIAKARADGDKLVESKKKDIDRLVKELYVSLGGKG